MVYLAVSIVVKAVLREPRVAHRLLNGVAYHTSSYRPSVVRVNISPLVLATTVPLRFSLSISSSISNARSVSGEACSLSVLSYRLPLLPHETFSLFINLSKSPSLKHARWQLCESTATSGRRRTFSRFNRQRQPL